MEYKNSVLSSFIKALYTEMLALEYTVTEHMKKRKHSWDSESVHPDSKMSDSIFRYPIQITTRTLIVLKFVVIYLSPTTAVLQLRP